MIRPFRIKKSGNKSDFECDVHHGTVKNLDLKTKTKQKKEKDDNNNDLRSVIILGSELTPPCNCITQFPGWAPKNKLAYELCDAKPDEG